MKPEAPCSLAVGSVGGYDPEKDSGVGGLHVPRQLSILGLLR